MQRRDLYSEALFCIEPLILASVQKQNGQFRAQGVSSDKGLGLSILMHRIDSNCDLMRREMITQVEKRPRCEFLYRWQAVSIILGGEVLKKQAASESLT